MKICQRLDRVRCAHSQVTLVSCILFFANSAFAQVVSKEYDSLAAKAELAGKQGNFGSELKYYQRAARLKLFEIPNVYLLPKMAIAAKKTGNSKLANIYLERSRLIAEIQFGFLQCAKDANQLIDKSGKIITSSETAWTVHAFCGQGYEYLYDRSSLDGYLWPANFLVDYDKAKQFLDSAGEN